MALKWLLNRVALWTLVHQGKELIDRAFATMKSSHRASCTVTALISDCVV